MLNANVVRERAKNSAQGGMMPQLPTVRLLRRTLTAMWSCLVLVALLAACGGTPTATPPPPTAVPTAEPIATPPPTSPPPTATATTRPPTATARPARPASPTSSAVIPIGGPVPSNGTPRATPGETGQFARVGLTGQKITALAASPRDQRVVFAGGKGVMKSTDGGKTWTNVRSAQEAPTVATIAIAPSNPQYVYVGISEGCAKGGQFTSFVSADGGTTWRASGRNLSSIAITADDPRSAYATSCEGVLHTANGGVSWEVLETAHVDNYDPALIAITTGTTPNLYVAYASEGGTVQIRRSVDGGTTWRSASPRADTIFGPLDLAASDANAQLIYLSTLVGLYRSNDGGLSWTLLTNGLNATAPANLPSNTPAGSRSNTTILCDPNDASVAWLGTGSGNLRGVGVFETRDAGETWRKAAPGLEGQFVHALALGGGATSSGTPTARSSPTTRGSRTLYAATDDGVWTLALP
jgi:photosystem II stability/assembly factor-like uncharacterized protein